jgi:hypothetical protein
MKQTIEIVTIDHKSKAGGSEGQTETIQTPNYADKKVGPRIISGETRAFNHGVEIMRENLPESNLTGGTHNGNS